MLFKVVLVYPKDENSKLVSQPFTSVKRFSVITTLRLV